MFVDEEGGRDTYKREPVGSGVLVEAKLVRLLVNTGGMENKRCRMPATRGVKFALQIVWLVEEQGKEADVCTENVCTED